MAKPRRPIPIKTSVVTRFLIPLSPVSSLSCAGVALTFQAPPKKHGSDNSVDGQPGLGEDDIFVMKFSTDGVKY